MRIVKASKFNQRQPKKGDENDKGQDYWFQFKARTELKPHARTHKQSDINSSNHNINEQVCLGQNRKQTGFDPRYLKFDPNGAIWSFLKMARSAPLVGQIPVCKWKRRAE